VPLSSDEPPSSSQVPDWLAKHWPEPQQLTPADVPQAVSQSESTVHEAVQEPPPPSSPPVGVLPLEFPLVPVLSSPLAPELLTEASVPVVVFLVVDGANPVELGLELPQAAMKPTAPRTVIRLRIERIFIWRLPSAAPILGAPHLCG
jgi:hypothetical protein